MPPWSGDYSFTRGRSNEQPNAVRPGADTLGAVNGGVAHRAHDGPGMSGVEGIGVSPEQRKIPERLRHEKSENGGPGIEDDRNRLGRVAVCLARVEKVTERTGLGRSGTSR